MVDKKPKASITKRMTSKSPNGMILEELYLSVDGDNLEECKKIFDTRWHKE